MKKKLQLEAGKCYRNRRGEIIRIVGNDFRSYTEDGRFLPAIGSGWDLICEVSDPVLLFISPRMEFLSISAIETAAGMPSRTLYKFLKGTRGLPKKHRAPLIEILKTLGYDG